jgi:Histidine kinase-, DNA gyrase B-, and HSP90-like ATPase
MREIDLPPFAPSLIESMRAIGYSLETAVADIIDNSVAAKSRAVSIRFFPDNDPYATIADDGEGLTEDDLTRAMQHGSQNPNEIRNSSDLGVFGLGLKTASLSQCRQLTVVSCKDGRLSGQRWDLDVIAKTKKWTLLSLNQSELSQIPHIDQLRKQGKGTLVLWRALDRLAVGEPSIEDALGNGMSRVRAHLALVFHRFLSDEIPQDRLSISINENPIEAHDPFLQKHKGTQRLPEDIFDVEGTAVRVQPFILPHYSRMSEQEKMLAAGEDGLLGRQGFYVYRGRRLIIGGTWFRLARRQELTKLARVRVDIPNTLDHLWTLDIKKSAAFPPAAIRENLKRTVDRIAGASKQVFRYRGRTTNVGNTVHVWRRIEDREGPKTRASPLRFP